MEIGCCNTDETMSDCMSERPQGMKFRKFQNWVECFESEPSEQSPISEHNDTHILGTNAWTPNECTKNDKSQGDIEQNEE